MEQAYSDTNAGLHYDLRLALDPTRQYLHVTGSLAYHSPTDRLERARFYLHHQFAILRVEGRRVFGYQYEPLTQPVVPLLPQASVLDVYFDPPLRLNETALIQFEYEGTITDWPAESANVITSQWSELGSYLPWFPFQYDGSFSNLTFTLRVRCPAGYQVSSMGRHTLQDGDWFFNWPYPTSDIVVAAGTGLETHTFDSEANHVYFSSATFSPAAAAKMGEDLLWTLERFSGWFGPTRPGDFNLLASPRALGGGYSRRGLVVLSGLNELDFLNQREAYLRYLAHEAAHAWWWEAHNGSWEDWLNESFAEFSALLALRERFGTDIFERFLNSKREKAAGLPPLWKFKRANPYTTEQQAQVDHLLYDQGPLLLNALAERIGYQHFLEFCRAMLWSGVTSTEHMLDLLEEVEDQGTKRWMEDQLNAGAASS